MEIICSRRGTCGFRADSGYFERKTRFHPGSCPRDGGPLMVVEDGTDIPIGGATIDLYTDRSKGTVQGRVTVERE